MRLPRICAISLKSYTEARDKLRLSKVLYKEKVGRNERTSLKKAELLLLISQSSFVYATRKQLPLTFLLPPMY